MQDAKIGRSEINGCVAASLLASSMLLIAIFGSPPYAFFGFLKLVVAASSLYLAYVCIRLSSGFIPVALVLAGIAYVHGLMSMRRAEWVTFNWVGIVALSVGSLVVLWSYRTQAKRNLLIDDQKHEDDEE